MIGRRAFLLITAASLTSVVRAAYADSVDQAVINCKLIVLSVITSSHSSNLGTMVDRRDALAVLQEFLSKSFAEAGVQIRVQSNSAPDVPLLFTLYVSVRIDLDIVDLHDSTDEIVGAVGTFFQKEGMSAHNSGHPLTFFTAANSAEQVREQALEAARQQLKGAVLDPIIYWAK